MRVLVCGGRDFTETEWLNSVLDAQHFSDRPISLIIQGGARGADYRAAQWAEARGVPTLTVYARWDKYGKSAGVIRNMEMVDNWQPDLVIAFPGGRGTEHMRNYASQYGVPVRIMNLELLPDAEAEAGRDRSVESPLDVEQSA